MSELVFFLEEPSAKAMLEQLVPRIVPKGLVVRYFPFEGKQDLEKQLLRRLRGYLAPDARFIILRDQDSGDCVAVKSRLVTLCAQAGRPEAVVRVACRELESWYLADADRSPYRSRQSAIAELSASRFSIRRLVEEPGSYRGLH